MAAPVVSLSLPQMVDLALGSPEVGSVNFNILHSLLHVMIQQLELQQCAVEFRGPDSERVQAAMARSTVRTVPTTKLSEYRVRDRSRRDKEVAKQAEPEARPKQVAEVDRPCADLLASSNSSSGSASDQGDGTVPAGQGARGRKAGRRRPRVSSEDAEEVLRLSRRRRFSAHLLEVLASSHRLGRAAGPPGPPGPDPGSSQGPTEAPRPGSGLSVPVEGEAGEARPQLDMAKLSRRTELVEARMAKLGAQGEEALQRLRLVEEAVLALTTAAATGPGLVEAAEPRPTLAALDDELLAALRSRTALFSKRGGAEFGEQVQGLQAELRQHGARLDGLDGLARGLSSGLDRVAALERRTQGLQADLDSASAHLGVLFRERDQRTSAVKALQARLQELEERKANRWQLEAALTALAEKADRGLVSAKVSHTEFTAACTNFHNDLGQARSKLTETESRLDSKLDRAELPAVAAELAERVERLVSADPSKTSLPVQQAAQVLQAEHFAAATKIKLLRNASCISCDGPRSMRCDDWCPAVPACDTFPDRRPTRPHVAGLAVGLAVPAAGQQQPGGPASQRGSGGACGSGEGPFAGCERAERLVTRFCGGSHTVTPVGARPAWLAHRGLASMAPAGQGPTLTLGHTVQTTPTPTIPVAAPCH